MRKKTDGGQEVPEGAKTQTGYCRFCGTGRNYSRIRRVEPGRG